MRLLICATVSATSGCIITAGGGLPTRDASQPVVLQTSVQSHVTFPAHVGPFASFGYGNASGEGAWIGQVGVRVQRYERYTRSLEGLHGRLAYRRVFGDASTDGVAVAAGYRRHFFQVELEYVYDGEHEVSAIVGLDVFNLLYEKSGAAAAWSF